MVVHLARPPVFILAKCHNHASFHKAGPVVPGKKCLGKNGYSMVGLGVYVGGIVLCRHGLWFGDAEGNVVKHIFRLIAQLGATTICNDVSFCVAAKFDRRLRENFAVLRSKGCSEGMKSLTNVPKYLLFSLCQNLISGKRPVVKFVNKIVRNSFVPFVGLGFGPRAILVPIPVASTHNTKRLGKSL